MADSFKIEMMSDFSPVEVNELSTGETSDEEYDVNEVSRGKKWGNDQYRKPNYNNNHNFGGRYQQNLTSDQVRGGIEKNMIPK